MLAQEGDMNLCVAASADALALGGGASSEEPASSPPGSGMSEEAAAAGTTSEEAIAVAAAANTILQTNLSSFVKHNSFYELCGLLGTKDIERSDFDVLCSKGMSEASGKSGNMDDTLGVQAGASLGVSLDPIFRKKGMAILEKCPAAAGWKGGKNSWGYCAPHPDYHVLKRARLTTEDSAQP